MNHDALSEAVWGEVWLKVRRELEHQGAQLSGREIDRLTDYRITKMAAKLVELLDKDGAG